MLLTQSDTLTDDLTPAEENVQGKTQRNSIEEWVEARAEADRRVMLAVRSGLLISDAYARIKVWESFVREWVRRAEQRLEKTGKLVPPNSRHLKVSPCADYPWRHDLDQHSEVDFQWDVGIPGYLVQWRESGGMMIEEHFFPAPGWYEAWEGGRYEPTVEDERVPAWQQIPGFRWIAAVDDRLVIISWPPIKRRTGERPDEVYEVKLLVYDPHRLAVDDNFGFHGRVIGYYPRGDFKVIGEVLDALRQDIRVHVDALLGG